MTDNIKNDLLKNLSPEKKEKLFQALYKGALSKTENSNQFVKRSEGEAPVMSFTQKRMWFLNELMPGNPAYNISLIISIKGFVDQRLLEKSINYVIKRHNSLRMKFESQNGKPVLDILPSLELNITKSDIRHISNDEKEAVLEQMILEENRRGFNLSVPPLLRATLIEKDEEEYVFQLVMHHIVSDGWSSGILLKEISQIYDDLMNNREISLPGLPIQYDDFSKWQKSWAESGEYKKQMTYWKNHLKDSSFVLELPSDYMRPGEQSYKGKIVRFGIPEELAGRIKVLAGKENVTPFMFLLAAFEALVFRYTRQTDIIIGSPIANRNRYETGELIGCFVNTLALRTAFNPEMTFAQLLKKVSETTLDAYDNQDLPFNKIIDEMKVERDMSRQPVFQLMFVLHNAPARPTQSANLTLTPLNFHNGSSKFDLSLELYEENGEYKGWFEYNTDLFKETSVQRFAEHYHVLLDSIVSDLSQRLCDLRIMDFNEKELILHGWNSTKVPYGTVNLLHQLFEETVLKYPEHTALYFQEKEISYTLLNRYSNKLAHYLIKHGVESDSIIGVFMERSFELVVALLAVLKAGAAYMPLDPGYPKDRIRFMLEDTSPSLVLTQERLNDITQDFENEKIAISLDWLDKLDESDQNPLNRTSPENLAYMIFTSGSTGRPKGVMNRHKSICNRLLWMQDMYKLDASDRVLQKTPYSFDVSVWEFFWPLLTGAGLVIAKPDGHKDSAYLADLIKTKKVTTIHFVPSMLRAFLEEDGISECTSLKRVICSGEALPYELERRFFPLLKSELHNLYGPTEAAVDVTYWACSPDVDIKIVPIGKPISNVTIYILDDNLQPVPAGVPGELHIGGIGLARGYFNRPGLTAEKFIPDPFSCEPGGRLYKTGDLARYLEDGNIEYLGRIDSQVKIRGFRIELEEIEAVLKRHSSIREAVVTVANDNAGEKRIIAYLTAQSNLPSASELKAFLSESLPEYMIPARFITLDALPVSNNGKLDRKQLPRPDFSRDTLENVYAEPESDYEKRLVKIWTDILKIEKIGVNDNFFELGGDSIQTIQVVAMAGREGLKLTPKNIFEYKTISKLAAAMSTDVVQARREQGIISGTVIKTPIQHWFFDNFRVATDHFNQAVALDLNMNVKQSHVENAVEKLIEHHDMLRVRFRAGNQAWIQEISPDANKSAFVYIDLSYAGEEEFERAFESEADKLQSSLDISKGEVVRAVYFKAGQAKASRLLIIAHHLCIDGVSWRILLEDLSTILTHYMNDQEYKLPEKTTSYSYWAERLNGYANSEGIKAAMGYWANQSDREYKGIPDDFDNTLLHNTVGSEDTVSVSLSSKETKLLFEKTLKAHRIQINDILIYAVLKALTKWTGNNDLLMDIEGHGREDLFEDIDLSRTVGWFTAIYPVFLINDSQSDHSSGVKRIRKQLQKIPDRGLSYGLLRYLCSDAEIVKKLKALSKADILFNYLGQFDQVFSETLAFKPGKADAGSLRSPKGIRSHKLEIVGIVSGEQLKVDWIFSKNFHRRTTIKLIANEFINVLKSIINAHDTSDESMYSVEDFPLIGINQDKLNRIVGNSTAIEDIYPLTYMQHAVLFHNLFTSKSGNNTQQLTWTLKGDVNVNAFQKAWNTVIKRHSILRTVFFWRDVDEPLQVVFKDVQLEINTMDWSCRTRQEQEVLLKDYITDEKKKGFQTSVAPLMRVCIIRTSDNEHKLLWSYWTSLFDNWSYTIITNEVFSFYNLYSLGKEPTMVPAPGFASYVRWFSGQDKSKARAFWSREFEGFDTSAAKSLNVYKIDEDYVAGKAEVVFTREDSESLGRFAKRYGLTLNTVLQGIWAINLSYHHNQNDIIFAILSSGRSAAIENIEGIAGMLVNTIPVRARMDGAVPAVKWLMEMQDKMAKLREFDFIETQQISKWAHIPQKLIQSAIYERTFVFVSTVRNREQANPENNNMDAEDFQNTLRVNVPMRIYATPGEKISLEIKYNNHIFSQDTAERYLDYMRSILDKLISEPEVPLGSLIFK